MDLLAPPGSTDDRLVYLMAYPTIWFDRAARESIVMPSCALLEQVFNQGI